MSSLVDLGQTAIQPICHFQDDIIDNLNFTAVIYVIPDHSVNFDQIVGTDVIQQGTLTISTSGCNTL